ncbi:MAG: sulfide/dihydroorotate dehydrogenase-like FAD/NAD-binding protein [bacterium]|nr:sulfide/dihydroorotate dehydrogenase-like FAD/NAD-binding protein [bacterium]MCX7917078.1 sulfide/dihydroorotate dehydrogenase-like FAD/NAD-binding protein [bacterium]MDW8163837.1 sulfide/dihydroorotate dehydrogenase-like FAD/NAD-binding protein [Candidatus Omnitrophota bacterium]
MNKIIRKEELAEKIKRIEIYSPLIAEKALPGQFVVLRVDERGERIPLTIAGKNVEKGTITLIFQEVGTSTIKLGLLEEGDEILDVVGPLGKPTEIKNYGHVCIIVGGVGSAFVFWMGKSFKEKGNKITTIIGARSKNLIILEEEMRQISDNLYISTDDGSYGEKGFNTEILERLLKNGEIFDLVLTAGPVPMMKKVAEITKNYNIKTIASLNPIMIDGTGMCGGCRVTVGGVVKFACVDGPDFDAHLVDFDELLRRISLYKEKEKISCERILNNLCLYKK